MDKRTVKKDGIKEQFFYYMLCLQNFWVSFAFILIYVSNIVQQE